MTIPTETRSSQKIPSEVRQKILGLYLFGKRIWTGKPNAYMSTGDIDDFYPENFIGTVKNDEYALLLSDLSDISDEHKYAVMAIEGFINQNDFTAKVHPNGFEWDDGYQWGRILFSHLRGSSIDYLRSLGYALPFTVSNESGKPITYSVEQLVKENVFKIKEG